MHLKRIPSLETIVSHEFDSNGVMFLPNSSFVVCVGAAGNPGDVLLYDALAQRPHLVRHISDDSMNMVGVAPNGTFMVADTSTGAIACSTPDLSEIGRYEGEQVTCMVPFFDSRTVLLGLHNGSILVWNPFDGRTQTLEFHPQFVTAIGKHHGGAIFASADVTCTVAIWDAASKALLRSFNAEHVVVTLLFNPRSQLPLIYLGSYVVDVWNYETCTQEAQLVEHSDMLLGMAVTQGIVPTTRFSFS